MAWDTITLNELDTTLVTEAQEAVIQLAEERLPDMDLRRGAMRGQLTSPLAILLAAQQTLAQKLLDSQSLLNVVTTPELYDADLVTSLLSNYRVTRNAADTATGTILLIFDSLSPVTVYEDTIFETDDGIEFKATQTVRGRTSTETVVLENDQLLTLRADGNYSLVVTAEAVESGTSGNIQIDTELTSQTTFDTLVAAYANVDFTGGAAAETNTALINRLQTGISSRTFSNRSTILGLLNDEFDEVTAVSVVGMSDAEMSRDQRLLLPISSGGRADVYVRSSAAPVSYKATLPATLVLDSESSPSPAPSPESSPSPEASPTAEYGVWQINIGCDVAPGFYAIVSIKPENATPTVEGYTVIDEEYGVDLDTDFYASDINSALEAAFSPFQTATVQFLDTDTDISSLDASTVQYYEVTLLYLPLIEDIHRYLTQRSIRPPVADLLVKAVVPNIISMEIEIDVPSGNTIDSVALKTAITTYINSKAIGAGLKNTEISAILFPLLPTSSVIDSIELNSRIILPNHTDDTVTGVEEVTTIDEPELFSTQHTIALMSHADDIVINVNYVETGE